MFFEHIKKVKKKFTKRKMIKFAKGSISIFLCLLITPFLSLTLALVEYARYQQVVEQVGEIYELAGLSALADYDTYIHDRFGLLATSQDGEVGSDAKTLFEENINILGNQAGLSNTTISGKYALDNVETLKRQVVDFGSLNATAAVIHEDLGLDELIEKLKKVEGFSDAMNTVDSLSEATTKVKEAVERLKELKDSLDSIVSQINGIKSSAAELSEEISTFYHKLHDNGINAENITDEYLNDIKDIYKKAKDLGLISKLDSLKTELGKAKERITKFKNAVSAAKEATKSIVKTNSVDKEGEKTKPVEEAITDILDKLQGLVSDTMENIKKEITNTANNVIDEIKNTAFEMVGLGYLKDITKVNKIINGQYNLSKEDIQAIISAATTVKDNANGDYVTYIKNKITEKLKSVNIQNFSNNINNIVKEASESLKESIKDGLVDLLTKLVNVVKNLFNLNVFYDPDLNAVVSIENPTESAYQDFLDTLNDLFNDIENFKNPGGNTFFSRIIKALKAVADMFKHIGELIGHIFKIVGDSLKSIKNLASSAVHGDTKSLYEKFLISGYMANNLPCRTDDGNEFAFNPKTNRQQLQLKGQGLTGFSYNDIARPVATGHLQAVMSTVSGTGFQSLNSKINEKSGTEGNMFKGAELEYIRAGTKSEISNQAFCFLDIYFLRLMFDLVAVFADNEVRGIAAGANIAAWVVYILYIVAEPFCDTVLLVNNQTVPLVRTRCWLTPSNSMNFIKRLSSAVLCEDLRNSLTDYNSKASGSAGSASREEGGLLEKGYKTHMLLVLLTFVDTDLQISRLKDLINLEATEYYRQNGEKEFNISKTYTAVNVSSTVTFYPFFDLGLASGGESLLPSKKLTRKVTY